MLINKLVEYCRDSTTKNGKCPTCVQDCDNACINCLEHIHYNNLRTYDCKNMIYCYTSSYIYKYASEIIHLINFLQYKSFPRFDILNLGCGSCADLFGVQHYHELSGRDLKVSYTGVDINEKWLDSQEKIKEIFSTVPNYDINFIQTDVFLFLDNLTPNIALSYNIVVLQYILNELNKHCLDRMGEFVDKFVDKVINNMPENSTVIINDINHYDVRKWFYEIFAKSKEKNLVSVFRKRFREPSTVPQVSFDYHDNDNILFDVINFGQKIKSPCSSAQFVIYKTKNL